MRNSVEIESLFQELSGKVCVADGLNAITYATKNTVAQHVSSFAEVVTEWYLFDSEHEKDIKTFLTSESIEDIFTESDFIDLIAGTAYLKNDMVSLIWLKIPFSITLKRLLHLNEATRKANKNARLITKPVANKIKEILLEKSEQIKIKKRNKDKKYYKKNREKIIEKVTRYYQEHKTELLARKKADYQERKDIYKVYLAAMYQKHKAKRQVQHKAYYEENKDKILQHQREYNAEHAEERSIKRKKYYKENKNDILTQQKQYRQENSAKIKTRRKKYYEANKEDHCKTSNEARRKRRQCARVARNVCAVYLFLMNLRKNKPEEYSKLYTKYQEPIVSMMPACVALQTMNCNLCSLMKCDTDAKRCACPKAFLIHGATTEIQKYIRILKQKSI
ncbi:MAG: hypothetical protein IKF41_00270 [Alphaproteobacteria bacterium]|nr:hypothetical protein [Alphaproteobacteria bacterium]